MRLVPGVRVHQVLEDFLDGVKCRLEPCVVDRPLDDARMASAMDAGAHERRVWRSMLAHDTTVSGLGNETVAPMVTSTIGRVRSVS